MISVHNSPYVQMQCLNCPRSCHFELILATWISQNNKTKRIYRTCETLARVKQNDADKLDNQGK